MPSVAGVGADLRGAQVNVYYNDNEPFCCEVLRARIADRSLPAGVVDDRDVRTIDPDELREFRQIHLFAGIGGFAHAQKWAGWPEEWSLITGGPPCQPTSVAGAQRGESDDRYLWPEMARLVEGRNPRFVLYENPTGTPELSLDRVCADLEGQGYEVWSPIVLPACALGAPHRRDRVWIVAHSAGVQRAAFKRNEPHRTLQGDGSASHTNGCRRPQQICQPKRDNSPDAGDDGATQPLADTLGMWELQPCGLKSDERGWPRNGGWWATEPNVGRVAHGVPARVDRLRALGNAIVPQVAALVMQAIIGAMR